MVSNWQPIENLPEKGGLYLIFNYYTGLPKVAHFGYRPIFSSKKMKQATVEKGMCFWMMNGEKQDLRRISKWHEMPK